MKTLSIIGSTGSIGKSSLKVYQKNIRDFDLLCLSANTNIKKLLSQKKIFKPKDIFLLNPKKKYKNTITKDTFLAKYKKKKIDYIISGISSFDAIAFNFELLKICKNLLIANKETIICGGNIFLSHAKKYNCNIIPIDSEHFCLDFFIKNFKNKKLINKLYLTASGGPFYDKKIKYKEKVTNILKHPTWKMGKKITVDSSTFANKVLELFEAKLLFNLKTNNIGIRVDQKSKIHAIIKLNNGLYFPIAHSPNMEIPIANALDVKCYDHMNFKNINIQLLSPDKKKFPLINLGYKILREHGHFGMILFTVINERLVQMFLKNQINYGDIVKILVKTFKNKLLLKKYKINNLNKILKLINFAKTLELCSKK